jgi:hypothetical protein
MAKRIRLSDDDGTTWYTLPGNTGSMSSEAGELDDTVFGQDFSSTFPGLIGWTMEANGLFKGYAGYATTIKKVGVSTVMTDEAMSLVSGKTYQITASTKRLMNRAIATTFEDGGVAILASNIESVDWLFGRVTFISSYTPAGAVTVTGEYFPTVSVGCANSFTLTQTSNAVDNTCMETARANDGHRTFEYGLKTVSLDIEGIYKASNGFRQLLIDRSEVVIEIDLAGNGLNVARGFFRAASTGQDGDVGDLESENITFNLSVPDPDTLTTYPFAWLIDTTSTMSTALKKAIAAWQDNDEIDAQYLPDGTNGVEGNVIITDLSLAGGLEAMNTFTVTMQGSGELVAVP